MIRRAFWLGAGAAAGILGYRRVNALGRRLSGTLAGGAAGPRPALRFARDVREGMDLYISRHPVPDGLPSGHDNHERKDGS
jgi:hypothetical protein